MAVPNPLSWAGDAAGNAVASGAQSVVSWVLRDFTRYLADAVHKVVDEVLGLMNASAGPNLDAGWWKGHDAQAILAAVGTLSAALMVGCLILAVVQGMIAGDTTGMLRSALIEVPVAVCGIALTFGVASLLLSITDASSAAVLQNAPTGLAVFYAQWTIVGGGNPVVLGVLLVLSFLAAFLLWLELLVRAALLYFLLALSPLAFAARVWPGARGVCRKLCELGIALIISKFAIALALGLGAAAISGVATPVSGNLGEQVGMTLNAELAGTTLLIVSCFTPFVLLRLIPVLEGVAVAQGVSRMPVRAAQSGMQVAYNASGLMRLAKGDPTGLSASKSGSTGSAKPQSADRLTGQRQSGGGTGSGGGGAGSPPSSGSAGSRQQEAAGTGRPGGSSSTGRNDGKDGGRK